MMDPLLSVVSALFGIVTGTCIGGKLCYRGAMNAAAQQILNQNRILKEKEVENNRIAARIVSHYVYHEIRGNYKSLMNDGGVFIDKMNNPYPIQYEYPRQLLKFYEFDKIKYDLLKYTGEKIIETLRIYDMFTILDKYSDLSSLTQREFDIVRETFLRYMDNYI